MKYIITESKYKNFIDNLLKERGIEVIYEYFDHYGDNLAGVIYLYKNGETLGVKDGYTFFYRFNHRLGTLRFDGYSPSIENVDIFKYLPEDETIKYFSDNLLDEIKMKEPQLFKLHGK